MIHHLLEGPEPRLDKFLCERHPEVGRARWDAWIREGRVHVNGSPATKGGQKLRTGDAVETTLPPVEAPALHLAPEDLALPTLFEDDQLWIVDKPSGMVVHPGPGHPGGTVVNALLGRLTLRAHAPSGTSGRAPGSGLREAPSEDAEESDEVATGWPGLVHRLDRYTTGCLALTKTRDAQANLQAQFKARTVGKTYLALVRHSPKLPELGSLLVDQPIARHRTERLKMAVTAGGREARTRVRVLARTSSTALVACDLLTGRTHQIRVHLAHLRAPLLGDPLYGGPSRWLAPDGTALDLPHPLLHAWQLDLDHPLSGARLQAQAPVPEAFRWMAERLGLAEGLA